MNIYGMGIDYTSGRPLFAPLEDGQFGQAILEGLSRNGEQVHDLARATTSGGRTRSGVESQVPTENLANPTTAGWTLLVNESDPLKQDYIEAVRGLAERRGMGDPDAPLVFNGQPPEEWFDWLVDNYSILSPGKLPHYILILGNPTQIPFHFQALLSTAASVGRLDLPPQELQTYSDKLVRLESRTDQPSVARQALVFATDGGLGDATLFSHHYLAKPLAAHIQEKLGFQTHTLFAEQAIKEELKEHLLDSRAALIFTASHGMGAPKEPLEIQKRYNGAICCQHSPDDPTESWLYSADDLPQVPPDEPFLEGSVFFQFACFGYGTPAESDFNHWLGKPGVNSQEDFVAALPRRLLAHPRGPVAYIGHVDTAWLHGFNDPEAPFLQEAWHPRIAPFVNTVEELLLNSRPAGYAMREMARHYNIGNALLSSTYDRIKRGKVKVDEGFLARLVSAFITRSDAQNYMVYGDPAARLFIPRREAG